MADKEVLTGEYEKSLPILRAKGYVKLKSRGAKFNPPIHKGCVCHIVPELETREKAISGVTFKNSEHQRFYEERLKEYGEWDVGSFKRRFKGEVGRRVNQGLTDWTADISELRALALKKKAQLLEKGATRMRVPKFYTKDDLVDLAEYVDDITDEDYLKLRALTQAYYRKRGIRNITLQRGVDGKTGAKYSRQLEKLRKADPAAFRDMSFTIKEDTIVGYTSEEKIALKFGRDAEYKKGITVVREVDVRDVFVSDDIWGEKTKFVQSEKETIIFGGEYTVKVADLIL